MTARDPYHSLLRDEMNLTDELGNIMSGTDIDLMVSIRRAAFLMSRLGNVTVEPGRALIRAALRVSPHPMAGYWLEIIERPRRLAMGNEPTTEALDPIEWAVQRHIEWQEEHFAEALASLPRSNDDVIEDYPWLK